ncbi:MAG TPA: hypothetical protein VG498_04205 [Terriglobales bacterium]|nr:hypothetical protein [Terriglobales bacterium]
MATNWGWPDALFWTANLLILKVPAVVPLPSELSVLSNPEVGAVNVPLTGTASELCP